MKSATKANNKNLSEPASVDQYKKFFDRFHNGYEPLGMLEAGKIESEKNKGRRKEFAGESSVFKAMTVFEFDNGGLLINSVPEMYRTFSIEFSRNLQKEYKCETPSEKATAELVALNFVRTLAIQMKIASLFEKGEYSDISIKYLATLSKELDRANRHYLNSLQTLRMIKQPTFQVNIKTHTAVVGQNQIVQTNHE